MEKKLSELVFILDKSGSMSGLESDTIGGFNATIKSHLGKDYDVLVTTVLFSNEDYILHDRVSINEIKEMDEKDYVVGGSTALIDAIGNTIKHIKDIHKYQRKEDIPDHTMFVIMTDGYENASHVYTSNKVKNMIEQQKEVGWEFVFLGANIDAVETAKSLSIKESRAVNYINDKKGVKIAHDYVSDLSKSSFACPTGVNLSDKDAIRIRRKADAYYKEKKECEKIRKKYNKSFEEYKNEVIEYIVKKRKHNRKDAEYEVNCALKLLHECYENDVDIALVAKAITHYV